MRTITYRLAVIGAMAFGLSACTGTVHRPRIISNSVIDPEVREAATLYTGKKQGSVFQLFVDAAENAYPKAITDPVKTDAQRIFMQTGFDLVKDRCRAYLDRKSDSQRSVNIWRDAFAPLTALATGAIGLVDNGETVDNEVLVALGLASSAATSGIKIYEERFLFSADNVNSVRKLLDTALTTDAEEKMELPDSRLRYTKSVEYIVSNQLICSPQNILELVQKAIENGNVVRKSRQPPTANDDGTPDPPAVDAGVAEPEGVTVAPVGP